MSGGDDRKRTVETANQRRVRLAAELRANLAKRKAQARARAQCGGNDGNDDAVPGSSGDDGLEK